MSKHPSHSSESDQEIPAEVSAEVVPGWLILLGLFVLVLVVVVLAVPNCQGSGPEQPQQLPVEEGVKTVDEALAAGGVSSSGDTNVTTAFAAYSWDELKDIAQEISASGSAEAAQAVAQKYHLVNDDGKLTGDSKPFTWDDGTSGAVQIAGFYHDDKTGGGKAGITFMTRDCLPEKHYMNASATNDGGWELSDLRAALNEQDAAWMPSEITANIVAVDKATNNIGLTDYEDVVTLTSDDVWLYSKTELCGTIAYPTPTPMYTEILESEGTQYQLFSDASVADKEASPLLLKRNDEEATVWWTRSPMPDVNTGNGYFVVLKAGLTDDFAYYPDNEYGIVLGFCF